jgi:hypothetical protein
MALQSPIEGSMILDIETIAKSKIMPSQSRSNFFANFAAVVGVSVLFSPSSEGCSAGLELFSSDPGGGAADEEDGAC